MIDHKYSARLASLVYFRIWFPNGFRLSQGIGQLGAQGLRLRERQQTWDDAQSSKHQWRDAVPVRHLKTLMIFLTNIIKMEVCVRVFHAATEPIRLKFEMDFYPDKIHASRGVRGLT